MHTLVEIEGNPFPDTIHIQVADETVYTPSEVFTMPSDLTLEFAFSGYNDYYGDTPIYILDPKQSNAIIAALRKLSNNRLIKNSFFP